MHAQDIRTSAIEPSQQPSQQPSQHDDLIAGLESIMAFQDKPSLRRAFAGLAGSGIEIRQGRLDLVERLRLEARQICRREINRMGHAAVSGHDFRVKPLLGDPLPGGGIIC